MRSRKALAAIPLVMFALGLTFAAEVTGKWTATIETPFGAVAYTYELVANGETLTGKAISQFGEVEIARGRVAGNEISFVENLNFEGMPLAITYRGIIAGDEIRFTRNVADFATEEFIAKRAE